MRWGCKFSFLRRAQVLYFFKYRVERRKREKNKVRDDSNVALEWIKILVFFFKISNQDLFIRGECKSERISWRK